MPSEDQKITPIRKPEEAADANNEFARLLAESERSLAEGELIRGRVIQVTNDEILVDIGYKSEGMIPRSEFNHSPDRLPQAGQEIDAIVDRRQLRCQCARGDRAAQGRLGPGRQTPQFSVRRIIYSTWHRVVRDVAAFSAVSSSSSS